jgi:hypothetical protein
VFHHQSIVPPKNYRKMQAEAHSISSLHHPFSHHAWDLGYRFEVAILGPAIQASAEHRISIQHIQFVWMASARFLILWNFGFEEW